VITKALLIRTIGAMDAAGRPVVAVKLQADGSITLLTADVPVPTRETDDWLGLAGTGESAGVAGADWKFDPLAFEAARVAKGRGRGRKPATGR
jgi:hypothetical protein